MNTKLFAALAPVVLLAACGKAAEAAPPSVTITNTWCRAAPAAAPAGGCYMTLKATADDRLVAVETTVADRAEIHTMSVEGGIMRMRRLEDGIVLAAGQAAQLKPGGLHIMVVKPKAPFTDGSSITLTLKFAKAPSQTLQFPVRTLPAAGGHQH